jgi:hypothetical protein
MKLKAICNIITIGLCLLLITCDDDKELASIVGKWSGDKATFTVNLLPFTEDDFDVTIEFKSDNTVTYTDSDRTATGTYSITADDLTITGIDVTKIPVSLSGPFDVKELSASKLVIEGEREGEIDTPDNGTISGKVKATLHFNKIN